MGEIVPLGSLNRLRLRQSGEGKKIVFTNGTFDILHRGHVEYLNKAKRLGDLLYVGLNSDRSVRILKGPERPVMSEDDRAYLLTNLISVDYVVIFDEETPIKVIETLLPDVLVKGADWAVHQIVGKDIVEQHGGIVQTIELTPGRSSSSLIRKIQHQKEQTEQ